MTRFSRFNSRMGHGVCANRSGIHKGVEACRCVVGQRVGSYPTLIEVADSQSALSRIGSASIHRKSGSPALICWAICTGRHVHQRVHQALDGCAGANPYGTDGKPWADPSENRQFAPRVGSGCGRTVCCIVIYVYRATIQSARFLPELMAVAGSEGWASIYVAAQSKSLATTRLPFPLANLYEKKMCI